MNHQENQQDEYKQQIKTDIRHSQRGASLLEIVAYLGVAAVIAYGAVSLMGQAFGGANTNQTLTEVISIRSQVKKVYMGQAAGYGTVSINPTLVLQAGFPSSLSVTAPSTVKNAWNGDVVVTGATSVFTISYAAVPQDICANLVAIQGGAGWNKIAVNGAAALTPPITPAAAGSACNLSANTIVWTAN